MLKHMEKQSTKKAFTLVELLIVIAIIGILFIVLISKVDFATDKAKATGVQTDFRSYQVALETVARENDGFNTFGWDYGDLNGNRIRDQYDAGDNNENGIEDDNEVWTGKMVYENVSGIYTLINPADSSDKSAVRALEKAINNNLDPSLHITIEDDFLITMKNGAVDPWRGEYHGRYITNAGPDGMDRGVILMYSGGPNLTNGSADGVCNGVVNMTTLLGSNTGLDDYGIATFYTLADGKGEVKTITKGWSNNQEYKDGSFIAVTPSVDAPVIPGYLQPVVKMNAYGLWLNRAYSLSTPIGNVDENGEQAMLDIEFLFKDDGAIEPFVRISAGEIELDVPGNFALFYYLLLSQTNSLSVDDGEGEVNIEDFIVNIFGMVDDDLLYYNMDNTGLISIRINDAVKMLLKSVSTGDTEVMDELFVAIEERIHFRLDYYTQTISLEIMSDEDGDGEEENIVPPEFVLALTDRVNKNVHMFENYEAAPGSNAPVLKPVGKNEFKFYGDTLGITDIENIDMSKITIKNHVLMVRIPFTSNGEVYVEETDYPIGFMSMDGTKIYLLDALLGADGVPTPIWSLDGFDNIVEGE